MAPTRTRKDALAELANPASIGPIDRFAQEELSPIAKSELVKALKRHIHDPMSQLADWLARGDFNASARVAQHINQHKISIHFDVTITPKTFGQMKKEAADKAALSELRINRQDKLSNGGKI